MGDHHPRAAVMAAMRMVGPMVPVVPTMVVAMAVVVHAVDHPRPVVAMVVMVLDHPVGGGGAVGGIGGDHGLRDAVVVVMPTRVPLHADRAGQRAGSSDEQDERNDETHDGLLGPGPLGP